MTIVTADELPSIRKKHADKKIVFCSGSYDLTHAGHVLFFEDCKKFGEILVVSVGKDSSIRKNKGEGRPILNEHIRLKTIDSFKPVDYAYINRISIPGKTLSTIEHAMQNLKPDVYVINEDAFDIGYRKELAKKFNIYLAILPRTCPPEFEMISATKIMEKIRSLPTHSNLQKRKAVFLDRDGVLIEDLGLIYKKEDVRVLPDARDALKLLKERGFALVVITNQPVIARGLISEEEVAGFHTFINEQTGNHIEKFYVCPHHPEMHPDVPEYARIYRIACECRKPAPGMILQAAHELGLDPAKSWMIGDMLTDIAAGKKAGCKTILLRSESNKRIIKSATALDTTVQPDLHANNLLDAANLLLREKTG